MDAIRHSPEGGLSYAILEAVGRTPHQIEQSLLDMFTQKTSAVLSNTRGTREPAYFAGSKTAGRGPGRANDRNGHRHDEPQTAV